MRIRLFLLSVVALSSCSTTHPVQMPTIDGLRAHIEYLASDEMKGRDNGTPEGRKAAEYVAAQMEEIGLEPAGRD